MAMFNGKRLNFQRVKHCHEPPMTGNDLYQLFLVMTRGWLMALFMGQSFLHVVKSRKNIFKFLKSGKDILKLVKSGKNMKQKHLKIG